jgi:hypothetical protein
VSRDLGRRGNAGPACVSPVAAPGDRPRLVRLRGERAPMGSNPAHSRDPAFARLRTVRGAHAR